MTDYPRPEWLTVEWLAEQTEVEWTDGSGYRHEARRPNAAPLWSVIWAGSTATLGGCPVDYLLSILDVHGVKSLTAAYDAPAVSTEVTIQRDQLRQAIIKAGPANPLRLLDELWATLSEGGAA